MSEPMTPVPDETQGPEEKTLEFKGETFRVDPDLSDWDVGEFLGVLEDASHDPEAVYVDGLIIVRRYAISVVHPDDRDRFKAHAKKHKASVGDLLQFVGLKTEDDAERPTERPSDSSDGPTGTEPKSAASSDGKDSAMSGPAFLRDRPDLALVVVDSQRHEARRAS